MQSFRQSTTRWLGQGEADPLFVLLLAVVELARLDVRPGRLTACDPGQAEHWRNDARAFLEELRGVQNATIHR